MVLSPQFPENRTSPYFGLGTEGGFVMRLFVWDREAMMTCSNLCGFFKFDLNEHIDNDCIGREHCMYFSVRVAGLPDVTTQLTPALDHGLT